MNMLVPLKDLKFGHFVSLFSLLTSDLHIQCIIKGLVPKETMVPLQWGSETLKFV